MGQDITIRFAPGLREKMLVSVGRWPPEHYAILSGRLEEPYYVTDFMPMPPAVDQRGGAMAGPASVTLNAWFIEYYLNMCLLPFGLHPLGVMHSHPGICNQLSNGLPGSGQGDIPSMRSHLEAAKRQKIAWDTYLAPILTQPGDDPNVTGWVIRLDEPKPLAAKIVWEDACAMISDTAVQSIVSRLDHWQDQIDRLQRRRSISKQERQGSIEALRAARSRDLKLFLGEHAQELSRVMSDDTEHSAHM